MITREEFIEAMKKHDLIDFLEELLDWPSHRTRDYIFTKIDETCYIVDTKNGMSFSWYKHLGRSLEHSDNVKDVLTMVNMVYRFKTQDEMEIY